MIKALFAMLCLFWASSGVASAVELTESLSARLWQALETTDSPVGIQERSILGATLALEQDNPEKALQMLNTEASKNDPLASLLKAEAHRRSALSAVTSAGGYAKDHAISEQQFAAIDLSGDLQEATVRLQAFADKVDGTSGFPSDLLLLGADIESVFLVDKERSRLFVYQRDASGNFKRIADQYVVTGAKGGDKQSRGDAKTPNGIYRFTAVRHDPALRMRYGPVVFPIDYPNALDKLEGKTGDGIWMHGYPENKTRRPPQDTRGCFALPNPILKKMEAYVTPGKSWVVIGENFQFNTEEKPSALLASVQADMQAWEKDWESLDSDAYLSHYHDNFKSGTYNLDGWKRYKKRVNERKKYIHVSMNDVSIIHDPSLSRQGETVVVEFIQFYESDNYNDSGRKRLYLARDNAEQPWKILIEESIEP